MAEPLTPRDPRKLGRWRLTSRLGFGGMGVVYLGTDGNHQAAVKVIRPGLLDDPQMVERFTREVSVLQAVRDVHISQFLDANLQSEPAWLAIEYISGPTVKQKVEASGPLRPDAWWSLAQGISQALAVLEVHRVTHRDIKPGNVIISGQSGERPVLIDFGIAHPEDATSLTATGLVTGSPSWLSPEQAHSDVTGAPSDIFSLGSLLAYAGTGHAPFGEGVAVAVLMRITSSDPNLDGLDPEQQSLVSAMLRKDPAARPTAREVLARARVGARSAAGVIGDHTLPGFEATRVLAADSVPAAPTPSGGALDSTAADLPAASALPDVEPAPGPVADVSALMATEKLAAQPVAEPAPVQPVVRPSAAAQVPAQPPAQPVARPVSQPATPTYSPPTPPPAPVPQERSKSRVPALLGVLALILAVVVGVVWMQGGGTPNPDGSQGASGGASTSASSSPSTTGTAPPAPSSNQLKSGDWLLAKYTLGNDSSSMWINATVTNRGTATASANLTVWIYVGGVSIGSVSSTVTDVPAGGSVQVKMTGDAKWQPGEKVVLLQANPA